MSRWKRCLPGLKILGEYKAAWFPRDVMAGLVLATMLVPVGIAYALASGVPGIYGLYATIVPLLAYALFGPSRILVLGPDSSLAPVILAVVLPLSAGNAMRAVVLAFLLACGSWLGSTSTLRRSAFYVLLLVLAIHTFGLVSRMYLQERPPVTNLYSSAIFIGWGAVIVALILERIFKDGIGAACAGAIGFVTLIIAYHLAGSGDTLEMLQAVPDTNIWLATHVVAITTGYSAMFLAGMLAIIYVVRGVFTRSLKNKPPIHWPV
jgi:ABC-type transport system involved in cytochrome c biogenesis permease subunit